MTTDLLAVFAHPDDAELLCGGTIAVSVDLGHSVGLIDLTRGELGSKGTPEIRAEEARRAAEVLGVSSRECLDLPDSRLSNDETTRRAAIEAIRRHRPRVVLTHYLVGRHPDHRLASELVRDACFLAGLKNYPADGAPFRPEKVAFVLSYREDVVKPTFIVDTTRGFERKLQAMACFASQWDGTTRQAGELYPTGQPLVDLVRTQDAAAGSQIRVAYGEPFWTAETMRVTDIVGIGVATL